MKYIGKILDNSAVDFCLLMQKKDGSKGKDPILTAYLGIESEDLSHLERINLIRWEKVFDKNSILCKKYSDDLEEMGLFKISTYQTYFLAKALGELQGKLFGAAIYKIDKKYVMPISSDFQFSPMPTMEYSSEALKQILEAFTMRETIDCNDAPEPFKDWNDLTKKMIDVYATIPTVKSIRFKGSAEWFLAKSLISFQLLIKNDLLIAPKCLDFVKYESSVTQPRFPFDEDHNEMMGWGSAYGY